MRIKLSYTTDEDELLPEISFLLARLLSVYSESLNSFDNVIEELKRDEVNISRALKNIDEIRLDLGKIDIRLLEVVDMLTGLEQHHLNLRLQEAASPVFPQAESSANIEGEEND